MLEEALKPFGIGGVIHQDTCLIDSPRHMRGRIPFIYKLLDEVADKGLGGGLSHTLPIQWKIRVMGHTSFPW